MLIGSYRIKSSRIELHMSFAYFLIRPCRLSQCDGGRAMGSWCRCRSSGFDGGGKRGEMGRQVELTGWRTSLSWAGRVAGFICRVVMAAVASLCYGDWSSSNDRNEYGCVWPRDAVTNGRRAERWRSSGGGDGRLDGIVSFRRSWRFAWCKPRRRNHAMQWYIRNLTPRHSSIQFSWYQDNSLKLKLHI